MTQSRQAHAAELTYGDIYRILRGSWMAIIGFAAAGVLVAGAIAFSMKPIYRAEVLLSPAAVDSSAGSTLSRLAEQFVPISGLVDDSSGGLVGKEVRIATLRSRRLTESFIRNRNLLPVLFPERWDGSAGAWKFEDGEPAAPTMDEAVGLFDKRIRSVSEDRRTGLVTLRVEWSDPRAVADWSNDLVARANEYLRARVIGESQRSIAFLESELNKTNIVERQQIIYRLIESKTSEIMMANARPEYAFVIVDPAVQPDGDNFVRPRRSVIVVIGLLVGLLAGAIYATVRWVRAPLHTGSAV